LQKIRFRNGRTVIAPSAWPKRHNGREAAKMLDLLALDGPET
jgi:hypothetical protein